MIENEINIPRVMLCAVDVGEYDVERSLDELEDDYFDLIVTLAPEAHHAALELTRSMAVDVMYWPTPDPAVATGTRDQIMHSYREVREHLKLLIEKRLRGPG